MCSRGHPDLDELIVYDRRGLGRSIRWGSGMRDRPVPETGTRPVRPDDRPAGAAPLGADDRRDAGEGPRRVWPTRARARGWFYTDRVDAPRLGPARRRAGAAGRRGLRRRRLGAAVQPADRRGGSRWARRRPGESAAPTHRAQRRRTMADEALAAGAFRRDRPPRRSRIRRGPRRRRLGR